MTTIDAVTLEVPDTAAAAAFYNVAFGVGDRLRFRTSDAPTTSTRAHMLSLVVSQPAAVDGLANAALEAGASALKPMRKSFWGYGGVLEAPDGTIWKIATSAKTNTDTAGRRIDNVVLLLGVTDVAASKRFYVDHGLTVGRSFGRKYVEFATGAITLALYSRRAFAKDTGVPLESEGPHPIIIGGGTQPFTDPDGFGWQPSVEMLPPAPATPGAGQLIRRSAIAPTTHRTAAEATEEPS